jgi:hypothetical protein
MDNKQILTTILVNQVAIMKALFSDDFKPSLKVNIEYTMVQLDNIEKEQKTEG